jgi:predicted RNase H-like HicB family nuclease
MKVADQSIKLDEWSEEYQCYVGSSPDFIGPCCHGNDETKVYKQLCRIIDEWVDIYQNEILHLYRPPKVLST